MSTIITARTKRPRAEREGAAMLVVMLLLLIVTATATFAVQSATTEIRASGSARQRMQTRYVAEGALVSGMAMLEQSGPEVTRVSLERSTGDAMRGAASPTRTLAPEEPMMAANQANHRIELADFLGAAGVQGQPLDATTPGYESLGGHMGYAPSFVVDVNDEYRFSGVVAGQRADGLGTLEFVALTYTARGSTAPPAGSDRISPAAATAPPPLQRGYHQTVSNARALGISGPTRRR